ncbi:YeaH/YhbH family protein [Aromatoleum toluclasticum]|uniref:YeaH/YhbH family protein n=1 Tax=Aromatoleum toluclasticum TaxID=92003 RepID=UPI001D1841EA|nr:YeaH/YhbH family protein [Aromatoleum toluclasticum]MCC4117203.1 YeaH/YhbH family protein [Aromatoleum toluclasticum]
MTRIIDRRFDSKKKSAVNRQRFMRRFKQQIRRAVNDAIQDRSIRDLDNGEQITIPSKDLSEPQFQHGKGGIWEQVFSGNDQFASGDLINRPPSGGGGGRGQGKASNEGEGEDDFVFHLSREEFLDIFFDDLALPNLVRTQLARISDYKTQRAGFTSDGSPMNINIVRSMRGALGRRLALGSPFSARLRELQKELDRVIEESGEDCEEALKLKDEIGRLRAKIEAIPFIDSFDLRYNNRIRVPKPTTQAVMFCVMDVSGSMDEEKKATAKRFFMLLYLFLTRTYEQIEVVFIRHHTVAKEVDEEEFFHSRESGGTVVSSALKLMHEVIAERYAHGTWNIYGAQASDGDNWDNDSPICRELLGSQILPWCQYFAYIEITPGEPQNLWREYEKLSGGHKNFALQRIEEPADIYPVFRELFKKNFV